MFLRSHFGDVDPDKTHVRSAANPASEKPSSDVIVVHIDGEDAVIDTQTLVSMAPHSNRTL